MLPLRVALAFEFALGALAATNVLVLAWVFSAGREQ
jgi:hypothetical protein